MCVDDCVHKLPPKTVFRPVVFLVFSYWWVKDLTVVIIKVLSLRLREELL